ncbi:hypothetical protein DOTSEDRAFT_56085 [Dothistroma septosporum NZE10]|uniref:GH16 domain-containing protein n=1 Tax=Dothistroma septosporum (strain NZE10 / CBS 128990) TaxID=675120 RepID=N1PHL4_DOTSN|nr:hypothetical protein DOTSEDRAFT_56085 [Dothistroma septosporum NZE10]
MKMLSFLAAPLLIGVAAGQQRNVTLPSQCSCGYRDPRTQEVYTEAVIQYFNETDVDQDVFKASKYAHKNQKGWNTIFPQGADPANVIRGNNGSLPWQDSIDGTSPSLEMWLDKFHFHHLSTGAELRSLRHDMLYGSFRTSMRSAQPWVGGSAMSMYLQFNDSQSINFDLLNMNAASQARVMQLVNGEWPEYSLATNYTVIQAGNESMGIPPRQPWDFMDLKVDWSDDTVDFWIFDNNTRRITKDERSIPTVPQELYFSHWSTGDTNYMQGPPENRTLANVRWVRAFFNSSLMTDRDHATYDARCNMIAKCSTEDITLRGSSDYSPAAEVPWKQPRIHQHIRDVAGYIAAAFSVFGVISIINAIIRRGPWHKLKVKHIRNVAWPGSKRNSTNKLRQSLRASMVGTNTGTHDWASNYPGPPVHVSDTGIETPAPGYTSRPGGRSGAETPLPSYDEGRMHSPWHSINSMIIPSRRLRPSAWNSPGPSRNGSVTMRAKQSGETMRGALVPPSEADEIMAQERSLDTPEDSTIRAARTRAYLDLGGRENDEDFIRPTSTDPSHSSFDTARDSPEMGHASFMDLDDKAEAMKAKRIRVAKLDEKDMKYADVKVEVPLAPQDESVAKEMKERTNVPDAMIGAATIAPSKEQPAKSSAAPQQRIDYLAGLVAICCIMVTFRHFSLTFWPYVTESQGDTKHFKADQVLSYILGPYFLTPLWIGPFFVTSCRFLAQRYLRTGNLADIANKMLLRAPRMLIPVFVFMILEYFLISLGLTSRLQWLPSVTYSVWPYVVPQPNFGVFLNEVIEITYIIPNAAPEIINHYCVGVLWTIPVQLQFSFVTLLATVLIKDVKKPWKRFLFYTLSILAGWYAVSWSACHWLGLMLADLDITYNWVKRVQAKWYYLYPILTFAFLITMATPLVLLFNSAIYSWSFMSWEAAIHPELTTARPVFETIPSIWYAYPDYYTPNLAILTFSVGLQIMVELSTWIQKALSIKIITFFHPHIMTIYLTHGFIFWSLGAYIAVALSGLSIPYWATLIVVAVSCYGVIFIVTIILTPLIDFATKGATKNIWRWATEEPVPHRQTTAPFSKELVLGRQADDALGTQTEELEKETVVRRPSQAA